MLFVGLAALLLANSLRGQLQETRGQLEEAQGQLKETQSELQKVRAAKDRQQKVAEGSAGSAAKQPSAANKSRPQDNTKDGSQNRGSALEGKNQQQQLATLALIQGDGGSALPYLLLLALGLVVLASLALVVTSALALRSGGWRSGKAGDRAWTPSPTEISNPERTTALEYPLGNPLEDKRWTKLVEECVDVVDELDEHMSSFDAPRREVAGHVIVRLEEILGRSGVEIISDDATFDRVRHKPDPTNAETDNGAAIHQTLSPGFALGSRVLRRARVRVE
jgi:molecular chaperone GrpE (heat shock protein)